MELFSDDVVMTCYLPDNLAFVIWVPLIWIILCLVLICSGYHLARNIKRLVIALIPALKR
jgi:hypothetical protein